MSAARIPRWAQGILACLLIALGALGATNSVHDSAKVFWSIMILGGVVIGGRVWRSRARAR